MVRNTATYKALLHAAPLYKNETVLIFQLHFATCPLVKGYLKSTANRPIAYMDRDPGKPHCASSWAIRPTSCWQIIHPIIHPADHPPFPTSFLLMSYLFASAREIRERLASWADRVNYTIYQSVIQPITGFLKTEGLDFRSQVGVTDLVGYPNSDPNSISINYSAIKGWK